MQEKKMTEEIALRLLCQDIKDKKDFLKPENKWILHSIYVGIAAKRISEHLGIDSEYATSLGYIHDIGRRINHNNHPIEGYKYLKNLGYKKEAKICLTHSFIENDINITAGGGPKDPISYNYIYTFLRSTFSDIYDNIIQLCDLFCLETGFTTIEKRLLDISNRKGIYDNSYNHFQETLKLKKKIENLMNSSLYELFPEIKKEDLDLEEENAKILTHILKK